MSTTVNETKRPYLTIKPSSGWQALNLREIWQFRDLLFSLADRDIKLRYRQTSIGISWVILQPLITAAIFTLVISFFRGKGMYINGVPNFVFIFAGLLSWNVFNNTINRASGSLLANAHLVSKVFFPRLILPISTIFSTLIDFTVGFVFMLGLMLVNHIPIHASIMTMPLWVLCIAILSIGIGLYSAALMVSYRDVQYVVPFFTQILFYLSPVLYSISMVSGKIHGAWYTLYLLNPMTDLLQAFQWSFFKQGFPEWPYLIYSIVISILIFCGGALAFKKMERNFADVI